MQVLTLCSFTIQGIITLILATDMARHAEIMDSFKETMKNFDYSNEEHVTLVSSCERLWDGCQRSPPQLRLETKKPVVNLALE